MSWEALLAIATLVGVALAAVQVWQGRRSARMDIDSRAVSVTAAGTQSLLQDAAVALAAMAAILDSIRLGLTQYGQGFFDAEKSQAAFQDLETEGAELDKLLARLKVCARAQVRKYFDEDVAKITGAREEFDAARARFEGALSPD